MSKPSQSQATSEHIDVLERRWRLRFYILVGLFLLQSALWGFTLVQEPSRVTLHGPKGQSLVIDGGALVLTGEDGQKTVLEPGLITIADSTGHAQVRLEGNAKGVAFKLQSHYEGARIDFESEAKRVKVGLRSAGLSKPRGAFLEVDKVKEEPKLRLYDARTPPFPMMECTTSACRF